MEPALVLSSESRHLAGILLLALVTVETGGLYLLKIITRNVAVTPFQTSFARAGHVRTRKWHRRSTYSSRRSWRC